MSATNLPADLAARFADPTALIPAIAQDAITGEVLMLAYMNHAALMQTLESKLATYWSRSRNELWVKGATSGHTQEVVSVALDCDSDAILLKVKQTGSACHTVDSNYFKTDLTGS